MAGGMKNRLMHNSSGIIKMMIVTSNGWIIASWQTEAKCCACALFLYRHLKMPISLRIAGLVVFQHRPEVDRPDGFCLHPSSVCITGPEVRPFQAPAHDWNWGQEHRLHQLHRRGEQQCEVEDRKHGSWSLPQRAGWWKTFTRRTRHKGHSAWRNGGEDTILQPGPGQGQLVE